MRPGSLIGPIIIAIGLVAAAIALAVVLTLLQGRLKPEDIRDELSIGGSGGVSRAEMGALRIFLSELPDGWRSSS